jgi:cytochrome oxidase Cu insertion factor (SCO1/SenC/PrrC family)
MNNALQVTSPSIVSAFHSALARQSLVILILLAVALLAWNVIRLRRFTLAYRSAGESSGEPAGTPTSASGPAHRAAAVTGSDPARAAHEEAAPVAEPPARRYLRIAFGLLWVLDGLLQVQSAMPLGLPSSVIQPTAAASPPWVQHLANAATTIWSGHPVVAAVSAVWIQLAIGLLLLVAPRGRWSRLAGATSVVWGLLVWVFGESFGGIFAPGVSWLFGAPGAVLTYCVAGGLLALPESVFASPRLGRRMLQGYGVFMLGMALLQAWPGRGSWSGSLPGRPGAGPLASMASAMSQTPQPHWLSSALSSFASFDAANGLAVNVFAVVALAAIGFGLLSGRRRLVWAAAVIAVIVGLADWVLVQDLGVLGGVGTDPNSMVPDLLLLFTGILAVERVPEHTEARSGAAAPQSSSSLLRSLVAGAFAGVLLLGAAPMAVASVSPGSDTSLAQAIDGTPVTIDRPAPAFRLVDQHGSPVSLANLAGSTVVLTFLDPVCTSDCPIVAQEMKQADRQLPSSPSVRFVAVVANSVYRSPAVLRAFDTSEGLTTLPNWLFLTGPLPELSKLWAVFGIQVELVGAGSMVSHQDIAYVIDRHGRVRWTGLFDPGPGTSATRSSFAALIDGAVQQVEQQG